MSKEANKLLFNRYFSEGTNKGDLSVIEEAFDTNYAHHDPAALDVIVGLEGVKGHILTLRAAFPDLAFHVQGFVSEDTEIVVRWTATGTHGGDYFGIPPTGKTFSITGMNYWRIGSNGKAVEGWVSRDDMGLMRQLGLMG